MEINPYFKNILKGKDVAIDYIKSKTYICDSIELEKGFLKVEFDDSKNYVLINQEHVAFIENREDKDKFKVVINYHCATRGTLEDIQGKFIVLSITNVKLNKKYHNIIPIKSLRGIKLYDEGEDLFDY